MSHQHRSDKSVDLPWPYCVAPDDCESAAAHGNILRVDTCSCGATQWTEMEGVMSRDTARAKQGAGVLTNVSTAIPHGRRRLIRIWETERMGMRRPPFSPSALNPINPLNRLFRAVCADENAVTDAWIEDSLRGALDSLAHDSPTRLDVAHARALLEWALERLEGVPMPTSFPTPAPRAE